MMHLSGRKSFSLGRQRHFRGLTNFDKAGNGRKREAHLSTAAAINTGS